MVAMPCEKLVEAPLQCHQLWESSAAESMSHRAVNERCESETRRTWPSTTTTST